MQETADFLRDLLRRLECIIDRVADAPALFKRLDPGEPISKLVRE